VYDAMPSLRKFRKALDGIFILFFLLLLFFVIFAVVASRSGEWIMFSFFLLCALVICSVAHSIDFC
jgi:hypothetical protein